MKVELVNLNNKGTEVNCIGYVRVLFGIYSSFTFS